MSRVNGTPAVGHIKLVEKDFHRTLARPGHAVVNFLGLLGHMNMNPGIIRNASHHGFQEVRRHGPQTMGRYPEPPERVGPTNSFQCAVNFQKPLRIIHKAALPHSRGLPAKSRVIVERRQHGNGNPRLLRRRNAAQRHFSGLVVRRAVGLVVQILEFPHTGKARLQHFHIGLRRNRFEIVGRKLERKAIHRLAPGPETVGARTSAFRQSHHQSLVRMRMNIGNGGDGNA